MAASLEELSPVTVAGEHVEPPGATRTMHPLLHTVYLAVGTAPGAVVGWCGVGRVVQC